MPFLQVAFSTFPKEGLFGKVVPHLRLWLVKGSLLERQLGSTVPCLYVKCLNLDIPLVICCLAMAYIENRRSLPWCPLSPVSASIMASATPFCFCTTQKHLMVKRSRSSMA
jgi:hypothetical protein